ncbi:hypothetical protein F4804DRAFT_329319 [Jackrogersella minutella]|nr:hypothetical protein F4804DRAFT_329319 [Jackrogersella minutella]
MKHFGPPGLFHAISTIHIIAVVVLLGLLASALHTRCFTTARANRRSGCGGGCRGRDTRCQQHGFWATRREAINNRYCEIVRWVKDGAKNDELEDEEKEAIMRQLHRPESDDEDNISTTMEQEIAQFRAVASVVGDIIEAEEGRSREMSQHSSPQNSSPQHSSPVPLSPTSAFPDCASIDEELPAYDEGSNDPRFVADGFRYTPGSSCYTPTESSTTGSSLDEHLGRKD